MSELEDRRNTPSGFEKAALRGSHATPSRENPFVTDSDPRNSDARTPTAHAESHQPDGADVLTFFGFHADPSPAFTSPPTDGWWLALSGSSPNAILLMARVDGDTRVVHTFPI